MENLDFQYANRIMNKPNNTKIVGKQQQVTSAFRGGGMLSFEGADGSLEFKPRNGLNTNVQQGKTLSALRILSQGAP